MKKENKLQQLLLNMQPQVGTIESSLQQLQPKNRPNDLEEIVRGVFKRFDTEKIRVMDKPHQDINGKFCEVGTYEIELCKEDLQDFSAGVKTKVIDKIENFIRKLDAKYEDVIWYQPVSSVSTIAEGTMSPKVIIRSRILTMNKKF